MPSTVVLVLIAAALAALGVTGLLRARSAKNWYSVDAIVNESAILEEQAIARFPHLLYTPLVRFAYELDGHAYSSSRLTVIPFDYRSTNRKSVELFIAGYPPGGSVKAYVKPGDPAYAALLPVVSTRTTQHYVTLVVSAGLLLLVAGLVNHLRNAA